MRVKVKMTNKELEAEFDRIDARLMKNKRHELFTSSLSFALGSMTIQEVIDYYQDDLLKFPSEYPKSRAECLMIIIQLLMIKIRRNHCNALS